MDIKQPSRINKTAFVRNVLKEIGALNANPPEGWRQKVEEALAKSNLQMHQVTIYQIRQKAIKAIKAIKDDGGKQKAIKEKTNGKVKPKVSALAKNNGNPALTVADLQEVNEFAKKFGGLDALAKILGVIKSLKS